MNRIDDMKQMYLSGKTLADIGEKYSLTRERVRQLLKKAGVSRHQGGAAKRSEIMGRARNAELQKVRDAKAMKYFGCSWAERKRFKKMPGNPANAYERQRTNAKKRSIGWEITLPEWWAIWEESGKWELRGRGRGRYVMGRYGDVGPYKIGNVFIHEAIENLHDGRSYRKRLRPSGELCYNSHQVGVTTP